MVFLGVLVGDMEYLLGWIRAFHACNPCSEVISCLLGFLYSSLEVFGPSLFRVENFGWFKVPDIDGFLKGDGRYRRGGIGSFQVRVFQGLDGWRRIIAIAILAGRILLVAPQARGLGFQQCRSAAHAGKRTALVGIVE